MYYRDILYYLHCGSLIFDLLEDRLHRKYAVFRVFSDGALPDYSGYGPVIHLHR